MMVLVLAVFELFLLVLHTSVLPPLESIFLVRPDLLLLFVLNWGLLFGYQQGLVAAILASFLMDMVGVTPLGAHLVAFVPVVLLMRATALELTESGIVMSLSLALLGTTAYYLALEMLLQLSGWHTDWLGNFFWTILPSVLVNMALAPGYFWGLRWLSTRISTRERVRALGKLS